MSTERLYRTEGIVIRRRDQGEADRVLTLCTPLGKMEVIASVDHRPVGSGGMGPITKRLRELYYDVVRGQMPRYRDWCTPVQAVRA